MASNDSANEELSPSASASPSLPLISFNLFVYLRSSHYLNGLRHLDYLRYRQYCTRRIRRLRVNLSFTHSSKQFKSRQIEASQVVDERWLIVELLEVERCWAYAMQLKGEVTNENGRPKFHAVNKLSRAVLHARRLAALCQARCDVLTQLQSSAYFNWLLGLREFERENAGMALQHFNHAARVYRELSSGQFATPELAAICEERMQELSDHMRITEYLAKNQRQQQQAQEVDDELLALTDELVSDQLSAQLASLKSQSMQREAATVESIEWDGKRIPVQNDKIRVKLVEHSRLAARAAEEPAAEFGPLLNCLDELLHLIQHDFADAKLDTHKQNLLSLSHFALESRLDALALRGLSLAKQAWNKAVQSEGKKAGIKAAEEAAAAFDKLIALMSELNELAEQSKRREFAEVAEARRALFTAGKFTALAECHRRVQKNQEAAKLGELAAAAIDQAVASGRLKESDRALATELNSRRLLAQALNRADQAAQHAAISSGIADLAIGSESNKRKAAELSQTSSLALSSLPSFPPSPRCAPCKPILFDLAFNHIDMPQFQHKISQEAESAEAKKRMKAESASANETKQSSESKPAAAGGGFFGRLWGNRN